MIVARGLRHALTVTVLVSSCFRAPSTSTPEGALDAFLRAVEESQRDPKASARAYALLSSSAQDALAARARRAMTLTGKVATPEGMFVSQWAPIRFEIHRMRTTIDNNRNLSTDPKAPARALVEVLGADPTTQHLRVPMVREGEGWRVELAIPPLGAPGSE